MNNRYAVWFRWVVLLGVLQDWIPAVPGIFAPNAVMGLIRIDRADDPVWAASASLGLVLLGACYIPGAIDPLRYRPLAVLTVVARAGGVFFFFFLYPGIFPTWFGLVDLSFGVVQGALLYLALRSTPTREPVTSRHRSRRRLLTGVGAVALLLFCTVWYELFREVPQHFASMSEAFKYGSIGTEESQGIPYWIWRVLPEMFPQYLPGPGGWTSLGFVYETGHDVPVGFSKKTVGFQRVGITCAVCHSGTYRTSPQQAPIVVATAPTTRVDAQSYERFLFACVSDPRFTADNVLRAIERHTGLSPLDEALYRYILIPQTRDGLLKQKQRNSWMNSRPRWGPGRIDPFNPVKFSAILNLDPTLDRTVGNSDMEPLWDMGQQKGYALHWDGLDDSLTEVVLTGALGDGASPESLPVVTLKKLEAWMENVRPPKYPYPINQALAARGAPIYQQYCASCHAPAGTRTGTVIPLNQVGTDRHRLDMWTAEAARRYNNYAANYPWRFSHFRKTDGYASVPLDGIWLRAPYLHNGSVPTMEDLLAPAAKRPKVFYRGYDVYDRHHMGFIHSGPAAQRHGFRYDTRVVGNGNQGHEGRIYGTFLSPAEKRALIEYLKTL